MPLLLVRFLGSESALKGAWRLRATPLHLSGATPRPKPSFPGRPLRARHLPRSDAAILRGYGPVADAPGLKGEEPPARLLVPKVAKAHLVAHRPPRLGV